MVRIWLVLMCLLPSFARAGETLDAARRHFEDMRYRKALRAANHALDEPGSQPDDFAEAYRIKGLSLAALGRKSKAVLAFRKLLAVDPDHELKGDFSPKETAPFYQAMAMTREAGAIRMVHPAPEPPEELGGLELSMTLEANPFEMVKRVRCGYRGGEQEYLVEERDVREGMTLTWRLPDDFASETVAYYFEALHARGGVLAREGSPDEPLVLEKKQPPPPPEPVVAITTPPSVPPPVLPPLANPDDRKAKQAEEQDTPWYKAWWFWTTVGVVVAGGAAAGTYLILSGEDTQGPVTYDVGYGL